MMALTGLARRDRGIGSEVSWRMAVCASCMSLAAGCGPPAERPAVTVRDSAGITIVESARAAWSEPEAWRLDPEPALRIGRQEGDERYLFAGIVGAVRLDDGRIAVGDRTSGQVRFYGPDGEFERAEGGKGKGPGEFEYMRALGRCSHDSIFAFDLHWTAVVLTESGDVVGGFAPFVGEDAASSRPYELACSSNGAWIATGWQRFDGAIPIGFYEAKAPVWILRPVPGEPGSPGAGRLQRLDIGEFVTSERIGSEHGSRPHPFGRSTVVAISDDAVFVGTAESFMVGEYTLDGVLRRLLAGPPVDLEIRGEDIAAWVEGEVVRARPESRPAVEREYRDMPLPPSFPAYTEARTDPEGALWLHRFVRPGGEEQIWGVFSAEGEFLGDVRMPPSLRVLEIGSDYVLGASADDLGVERVELYDLHKTRG
jgi:hypothetical protein